ncbi:MAG: XRE family transcriptional regulator [Eubacteriales bacterium]|nr:XRE family transcriptional regulator [Eubacteriales bacterium]
MSEQISQISDRIRELREISEYTISDVAAKLGVSVETYESYESEDADIPISVLYAVANLFGVDMAELLTGLSPKLDSYYVSRSGKRKSIDRYPGYKFWDLAGNFQRKIMEPLLVEVDPEEGITKLVTHSGQEFNYVIEGVVKVVIKDKEILLEAGDSIYFDPMLPHGQQAMNGKKAKFITIISE